MDETQKKPSRLNRGRAFIDRHRLTALILAGAIGIAAIANIALALLGPEPAPFVPDIYVKPRPKEYFAPLTGLKVGTEDDLTKPVYAIMIENNLEGRPQSGLKDAEVVYEAIAEGGITRFMAFYQQNRPSLIGPVRSIRPYDINWAVPYQASLVHVGGSKKALDQLKNSKYRNLDQFFNPGAYWRTADRYPPDNMYTNYSRLSKLNASKGYKTAHPKGFVRGDDKPAATPLATKINIHISSYDYDSSYTYDAKHNNYVRSMGGSLHKDRERGVISPTVVIAMYVNEKTVLQYGTHREELGETGNGKLVVFQNGEVIKGTWHRAPINDQYSFTDSSGKEIKLARGQTWLTALPNGRGSATWTK